MRAIKRYRGRGGFTLTELMITIALIGTMSAIAIPNFLTFQARSRRSEAYTNLAGLSRAYKSYYADRDRFPDMLTESGEPTLPDPTAHGKAAPNTVKMPWDAPTETFFDLVGWKSDGPVYYTYEVVSDESGTCSCSQCFSAIAHGDVDGDTSQGQVSYVHPQVDSSGAVVGECLSGISPSTVPTRNQGGVVISIYDEVAPLPGPY